MERKSINELTPIEFEKLCLDVLAGYAEEEDLKEFNISHNKIIKASDGKYQIDVYAEFKAMGTIIKVLCECKKYKNRVGRDKVEILKSRLNSVGANKGILISTSDFQSGAIEFAKAHAITLIKVDNYNFEFISYSSGSNKIDNDDPFFYAEKNWPPYVAINCCSDKEENKKIYPTKTTVSKILIEMNKKVEEKLGRKIDLNFDKYIKK